MDRKQNPIPVESSRLVGCSCKCVMMDEVFRVYGNRVGFFFSLYFSFFLFLQDVVVVVVVVAGGVFF